MSTEEWICVGDILVYGYGRVSYANPLIVTGVFYDDIQETWVAELKNLSKGTTMFMDCWDLRRNYRKFGET